MTTNIQENDLDKETLEQIKSDLLQRKEQILKDMEGVENPEDHRALYPEYGNKDDENAMEITEYTTNLATEKVLDDSIRDIDSALKRIEDGTYGICKYCHKPIGRKRLLARPVASACVECKTKLQSN